MPESRRVDDELKPTTGGLQASEPRVHLATGMAPTALRSVRTIPSELEPRYGIEP
jgi:hypothetical protein